MRSIWKVWFSKRRKIYFRIARKFHTTPWKVYQLGHGGMSKNKKDIKIFGSQGQNRTAMLSLKLAELQVIYDEIGEYPILLLDDFMSELDKTRRKNFLENIEGTQVIITGTEKLDIENLEYLEYNVSNGKVLK